MRIQDFTRQLTALGAKPCHIERVLYSWLHGQDLLTPPRRRRMEDFFPLALRAVLPSWGQQLAALARVHSEHPDDGDGSARLLVALADGQTVESVLLPRDGVCISSQIGCAVGCAFCMTGREGLVRQLGSAEMVAQVLLAKQRRPVKRVVFMGMGEPAHNLDNVLEAIDVLGTLGNLGHKQLVLSTVGDRRVFERLPQGEVKPALAISLHTTRAELRRQLLPKAPDIAPAELIELGEQYARSTGYPVVYQWTLLDGINDTEAELEALLQLLKGKYALLNFIPFNRVDGLPFQRPSVERANYLAGTLHQHGIITRLRNSAGQEVDGGCGQLRARHIPLRAVP